MSRSVTGAKALGGFMRGLFKRLWLGLFLVAVSARSGWAQKSLTWQEVRDRFEQANPTLRAGQIGIDESRAQEITAYLRPNPNLAVSVDGIQLTPSQGVWRPLAGATESPNLSYLHERRHKRELRLESAQDATKIAVSGQADLERTLLFSVRQAFIQTLQEKAVLLLARENLSYYDHVLDVNRDRYKAGAIAQVDLDRLEIQRVQYESDLQTAEVNLRTAKIELLALLNDRTPVEQFDVTGPFDFSDQVVALDAVRQIALDARPDLREALQTVEKAKTHHRLAVANGSTDPTFAAWWTHNPSFNNPFDHETLGLSVSVPLRIFDRNQGEKLRTQLDIGRSERLRDAAEAQVLSDVDSAYWTLVQNVNLLKPYKGKYLPLATDVRDRTTFSFQNGGASLLDFLDAEKSYRDTRLAYLNLIGSYLTTAAQMNMAVGQEVLQ